MKWLTAAALLAGAPLAAQSPSIREMIAVTDLSSIAISPDGRLVAFREERALIEQNGYDLAWYVVPADGTAPPRRIGGAGEGDRRNGGLMSEPPVWTADSRAIIYRAVIDGQVQLWRAAADGSATEQITHDPANIIDFALDPGPGLITYSVGASREAIERAEEAEYDNGVLVDAHVDPAKPLFRNARIDGRWASSRLTGFWFATGGLLADTAPTYRTLDLATLTVRPATTEEQARLQPAAQPFDTIEGRQILARIDSHDERGSAYLLASGTHGELAVMRGGSPSSAIICARPACRDQTIVSVGWQARKNRLLFATTDNASNHTLWLWDVAKGDVRRVKAGAGTLNGGRDGTRACAIGGRAAVCVSASANEPPRLVRIDLASGTTATLARPNVALERWSVSGFTAIGWRDAEGRTFTGQLLLPSAATGPVPLFLTYYVCDGYLRGGTGDEFPLRQMAAHGIAVLCVNRPLTSPGLHDQAEQYRIALSGLTSAVDMLAGRGLIDRRRIGMGGVSFGGEVTMWTAIHSDLLAAASISTSLITPTYYWFSAMAGRDAPDVLKKVWGLGDPEKEAARWKQMSPALNASSIHAPLLMQEPEQEFRFNMELAAKLSRSSTPFELWAFPGGTHIKYQPRHQLAANQRNLDWFRYWLQAYVDPDPTKAEQYLRWEAFERQPSPSAPQSRTAAQRSSHARSQTSTSAIARTR